MLLDFISGLTALSTPFGGIKPDTNRLPAAFDPRNIVDDAFAYAIDAAQRSILFWDVLRQRGNSFHAHNEAGEPPLLDFAYEVVLDARSFPRPANYALLRILPKLGMITNPKKRPFVIVDPRAGHGPGIGGMKEDSQVGVSLRAGHPTYFVTFFPEPMAGQTISDVASAEAQFIEKVRQLHPDSEGKPCVIGNCQAGWAVLSLSAIEPDLMGPVVVCGSPMSYWAGVDGKNPLRYLGGLFGGAWLTAFLCDIGGGTFDGANLVANFERLNPANTYWLKLYNLYKTVDSEAERFLEFERWWSGFFFLTKEEMMQIVQDLFVGDKLARGAVRLADGTKVDLKDIESPVVVFASGGDNITPPQQALNWIADVYGTDEEIRVRGKTVVYVLHRDIGHLGIFVARKVAQKEHHEINEAIDFIDILPPGLYEMIVEPMPAGAGDSPQDLFATRFEPRTIADLRGLDDRQRDVEYFPAAKLLSEINTQFYESFLGPMVRTAVTLPIARAWREMHPLRLQQYLLSDHNPWLWPLHATASLVRERRQAAAADNPFRAAEQRLSDSIVAVFDHYRDVRDKLQEQTFKAIYGPRSLGAFLYAKDEVESFKFAPVVRSRRDRAELDATIQRIKSRIEDGGFVEGWARIVAALMLGSGGLNELELEAGRAARHGHPLLKELTLADCKRLLREQCAMLQLDEDKALQTLTKLLPTAAERREAWRVAKTIALGDGIVSDRQRAVLARLSKVLQVEPESEAA